MRSHDRFTVTRQPLQQTEVPPAATTRLTDDGALFVDFGKAAFGTLVVPSTGSSQRGRVIVHLGEQVNAEGRVCRCQAKTGPVDKRKEAHLAHFPGTFTPHRPPFAVGPPAVLCGPPHRHCQLKR
jgi:hypothetical protein